jgi:hypothetical protein
VETCGATAATSASEAIASESPRVRVVAEPAPWRTKPLVAEPGWTVRRFVPRFWIRSVIPLVAPWATDTSATIEPTPMMTPSIVSTARRRAAARRETASWTSSRYLMRRAARPGRGPAASPRPRRPNRG